MYIQALSSLGVDLRGRASGTIKTTCPQCSHLRKKPTDPCLSVDIDAGLYHCFNCDWSGSVNGSTRAHQKPSYRPGSGSLDPLARQWLNQRGISDAAIDALRVESRVAYMPQVGHETGVICFPYFRGDEVLNVKYRDAQKHFRLERDAELLLFNENSIEPDQDLIICEGEISALSLITTGYTRVVSVPNGAPPPNTREYSARFGFLVPVEDRLRQVPKIILAVDGDAPGQRLAEELTRRLGPEKCWTVSWPIDCKDPDDVIAKHGPDRLRAVIDAAKPVPVAGLYDIASLTDAVFELYDQGLDGGIRPSNEQLAELYRVNPGQWTIITGVPSSGKSAWLDWISVDLARNHGWRFAVCSPENQPLQRHVASLLRLWLGKPFAAGRNPRMEPEDVANGLAKLHEHYYFILPGAEDEFSLDRILDLARQAVYRYGIQGVIVDPWNELEHQRPGRMSETEYVSAVLTKIRRFARTYRVHVFLVAHPTKLYRGKDGAYPIPTLYDISGSSHFRNKADMGVVIHRESYAHGAPTTVYVQKVRFAESGRMGSAVLYYDSLTGHYYSEPVSR